MVEDDRGRLAAELERDRAQQPAADLGDLPAGRGRAGEGDLVHVPVLHQVRAELTAAGHDVDHARGQAGRDDRLGEHVRVEHRLGGGFKHDRVARGQRIRVRVAAGATTRTFRIIRPLIFSVAGRPDCLVGGRTGRDGHDVRLGEAEEALPAELAAEAGLLEPAKPISKSDLNPL